MYGKNRVPVLRIAFTLISAAVLCVSSFASEQAPGGKRYAILVGINEYADSAIVRLSTPRNDAKDLGELLSSDGWDKVFILRDDVDYRNPDFPSRTNIENRVHLLADLVKPEDTIFFFFSGHGISTERGSSILPVDAAVNRIADTGISLSSLLSVFTDRGLRKLVVAVDACREEVSTTKGLSIVGIAGNGASGNGAVAGAPVGGVPALTLYATKVGWYSYEDAGGRNGVFTRFMLEGLSGKADSAGNGDVTFAELASWLPDATSSYALDRGIRQQAVASPGSGDMSALEVPVSRVQPGYVAQRTAPPVQPRGSSAGSDASGKNDIKPLLSSISGQFKTALVNSLKEIDSSLAQSGISEGAGDDAGDTEYAYSVDYEADSDIEDVEDESDTEAAGSPIVSTVGDSDSEASPPFSILQVSLFSPVQLFP